MPRKSDTRERVLNVSTGIFRRQGYAATGLKQIVSEGEAPVGSLYHFFPGGKQQIGEEALVRWGEHFEGLIDRVFGKPEDVAAAVATWFEMAAKALARDDYADGCPVGAVAAEVASTNEALRIVCAEVFEAWQSKVAVALVAAGIDNRQAQQLAALTVSTLEGALMMSRVTRSPRPLTESGPLVAAAIRSAVERRAGSTTTTG